VGEKEVNSIIAIYLGKARKFFIVENMKKKVFKMELDKFGKLAKHKNTFADDNK
jgi:hypothetical protein